MKRSRALVAALFTSLLFAALVCSRTLAQTPPSSGTQDDSGAGTPLFRANVNLVTVDAAVLNKKPGRALGPLTANDFTLYENGAAQRIEYFSQDELPLSVVLLFDLTDSV